MALEALGGGQGRSFHWIVTGQAVLDTREQYIRGQFTVFCLTVASCATQHLVRAVVEVAMFQPSPRDTGLPHFWNGVSPGAAKRVALGAGFGPEKTFCFRYAHIHPFFGRSSPPRARRPRNPLPEGYGPELSWMPFDVAEELRFQELDHFFGLLVWHRSGNAPIRNQRMASRALVVVVDWLHISPRRES